MRKYCLKIFCVSYFSGQEDAVGTEGDRNVDYGIEGSEEGVGQEEQVGENAASKLKRINLQRPRFVGR